MTIDPPPPTRRPCRRPRGTITIALDAAQYPTSVNNFVFLAQNKFYNGAR